MARCSEDPKTEPAVVLIPDHYAQSMDAWLTSLRSGEPTELRVSGAALVEQGRQR